MHDKETTNVQFHSRLPTRNIRRIFLALYELRQDYSIMQFLLAPSVCSPYRHSNSGVSFSEFQAQAFSQRSHCVFRGRIEVQWAIWVCSVGQSAAEKVLVAAFGSQVFSNHVRQSICFPNIKGHRNI
jgi:hypothetical protein